MQKKYIYLGIVFVLAMVVGALVFLSFRETEGRTLNLENYGTSTNTESTGSTTSDTTGEPSMDVEEEDYPYLTELSYNEWKALYDKGERFVFTVVQTTCGYCKMFKPVLNKIAQEHDVPIYYVDVLTLSDQDFESFMNTVTYFKENERWGTPLTLIYEDKQEIDVLNGYVEEEEVLAFLEENKML